MDRREELKIKQKSLKCRKRNIKSKGSSSLVKGNIHEQSDIDLVGKGLPPELYIKSLVNANNMVNWTVEVNLIPFEDAFESLKEKTLRGGELTYE